MATRTTTTRTTRAAPEPSADPSAVPTLEDLVTAYRDCRRNKRNSASALAFEQHVERNLAALYRGLLDGTYSPGPSVCFVVMHPKPREVWAADFRDRIVHHLLYNRIAPRFHARFIAASCACIPGRGTLYAGQHLEHDVRAITHNWSRPAFYLKCDLANFFVAIDKRVLFDQLARHVTEPWWLALARQVLFHDPRPDVDVRSPAHVLARVPPHKSLFNAPVHCGLPIGNLSSQFFANVYLNGLDQFIKHQVGARRYVRYVDDFILLHESTAWLRDAHDAIEAFLPERLGANLNPRKTILQPIARGIDFVGHIVKPWRREVRPRIVTAALRRIEDMPAPDVVQAVNSYMGLLRQSPAAHHQRALVANAARKRGHCVDAALTKAFNRGAP